MEQEMFEEVSLETLGDGAAAELFALELSRVLRNIQDPNTAAEAKRKVTLSVLILPDENRETGRVIINCNSKLAGLKPANSMLWFTRKNGKHTAVTSKFKQGSLELNDPKVIDLSKGELK